MIVPIIIISLFSIILLSIIVFTNHNLYCILFNYKDRKLWKKFIKEYQNFKSEGYVSQCTKLFFSKDNKYHIWIWHNGLCSVFDSETDECILSDFDRTMSKKMANLLTKNN